MIVANLEDATRQASMTPALELAFDFLRRNDLAELADGRLPIDGEHVYAILTTAMTAPLTARLELEKHDKYLDIYYLLTGREIIAVCPSHQLKSLVPYENREDASYGTAALESVSLIRPIAGQVVILYPTDAHAPMLIDDEPGPVRKVIVKVAIESSLAGI